MPLWRRFHPAGGARTTVRHHLAAARANPSKAIRDAVGLWMLKQMPHRGPSFGARVDEQLTNLYCRVAVKRQAPGHGGGSADSGRIHT